MECKNCGGNNIEEGIAWGIANQALDVGLKYNSLMMTSAVSAYSDVCMDCGEILRIYIMDKSKRKWKKNPQVK